MFIEVLQKGEKVLINSRWIRTIRKDNTSGSIIELALYSDSNGIIGKKICVDNSVEELEVMLIKSNSL